MQFNDAINDIGGVQDLAFPLDIKFTFTVANNDTYTTDNLSMRVSVKVNSASDKICILVIWFSS